jgi:hypothetical protein
MSTMPNSIANLTGSLMKGSSGSWDRVIDRANEKLSASMPPATCLGRVDRIGLLPPSVADKLTAMRENRMDVRALSTDRYREELELVEEKRFEEGMLRHHLQPRLDGGYGLSDDDPRVVRLRAKINNLNEQIARFQARNAARSESLSALSHLEDKINMFLNEVASSDMALEIANHIPPTLQKNETPAAAVERARRKIRELQSDLQKVRMAPLPADESKRRMRAYIENLAAAGRPDFSHIIDHRGHVVQFPQTSHRATVYLTDPQITGFAAAEVDHTIALLMYMLKDTAIAAYDRAIDEDADHANALSDVDRNKRETEVLSDLLAEERDEEHYVTLGIAAGVDILRRPDADPRAVLGVVVVPRPALAETKFLNGAQ